jgi:carboxymethylenebutenolidase
MLNHRFPIFLMALSLFFTACQNNNSAGGRTADGTDSTSMGQFVDDENFKNQHEMPGEAAPANTGKRIEFDTPDGKKGSAYALMTETPSEEYLLVFHEWWGLNDHIRQEAERYFDELDTVNVLALDLYDGEVATTRERAGELTKSVREDRAKAIIQGALDMAGPNARIGTIGWCFGGGWSLKASIQAGDRGEACVMYYGMPVQDKEALMPLQAPVLAIFARQDEWITPEVAQSFEDLAVEADKTVQVQSYDADHAFANPSSPRYDQQAARTANQAAQAFLKANL